MAYRDGSMSSGETGDIGSFTTAELLSDEQRDNIAAALSGNAMSTVPPPTAGHLTDSSALFPLLISESPLPSDLVRLKKAAKQLGVKASEIERLINDGAIRGYWYRERLHVRKADFSTIRLSLNSRSKPKQAHSTTGSIISGIAVDRAGAAPARTSDHKPTGNRSIPVRFSTNPSKVYGSIRRPVVAARELGTTEAVIVDLIERDQIPYVGPSGRPYIRVVDLDEVRKVLEREGHIESGARVQVALPSHSPMPSSSTGSGAELVRPRTIAKLLGVAADVILDLARRGEIPAMVVNGAPRFRLSDLEHIRAKLRGHTAAMPVAAHQLEKCGKKGTYLTPAKAARHLQLPESVLLRLIEGERIPVVWQNGKLYIRSNDLPSIRQRIKQAKATARQKKAARRKLQQATSGTAKSNLSKTPRGHRRHSTSKARGSRSVIHTDTDRLRLAGMQERLRQLDLLVPLLKNDRSAEAEALRRERARIRSQIKDLQWIIGPRDRRKKS